MVKIYKQPFAHDGDTIAIPDASQPDGKMSSADGWTTDYQLPKTDPNYKPVGRQEMNGVFKEVTEALGQVQVQGTASWSADGAPYPISAQVYHNGKQWLALRANSVEPAAGADWTELVGLFGISPQLMPITGNFNTYLGNFYGTTRGISQDGIWENCPPCIADNGRLYGGLLLVAEGDAGSITFTKQSYTVWEKGPYYSMSFTRTDHRGQGWSHWRTNNDLLESWRSQDGFSWYRKWTDGFIDQGGWLPWKDTYTIVNLFKPYTRVEYQVLATLGQPYGVYPPEIYMENPTTDSHTLTTFSMFSRTLDKTMYTPPLFWRACGY